MNPPLMELKETKTLRRIQDGDHIGGKEGVISCNVLELKNKSHFNIWVNYDVFDYNTKYHFGFHEFGCIDHPNTREIIEVYHPLHSYPVIGENQKGKFSHAQMKQMNYVVNVRRDFHFLSLSDVGLSRSQFFDVYELPRKEAFLRGIEEVKNSIERYTQFTDRIVISKKDDKANKFLMSILNDAFDVKIN